jgi:hypothetical protein
MAPITPQGIPASLAAGETWLWTAAFGDFPSAEGWTLSYRFRGASVLDTIAADLTSSADTWTLTLAPARTAALTPGNYRWQAVMTGSGAYAGRVHTADEGVLEVTQNLATADDGAAQSWEEKTLGVIEAVLTNKITDDISMYMIAGRQVLTIPMKELLSLRGSLKRKVYTQRNPRSPYPLHRVAFNVVT